MMSRKPRAVTAAVVSDVAAALGCGMEELMERGASDVELPVTRLGEVMAAVYGGSVPDVGAEPLHKALAHARQALALFHVMLMTEIRSADETMRPVWERYGVPERSTGRQVGLMRASIACGPVGVEMLHEWPLRRLLVYFATKSLNDVDIQSEEDRIRSGLPHALS